jgi:putative effector of murein hydrolase LrgA (UPF0299 family)
MNLFLAYLFLLYLPQVVKVVADYTALKGAQNSIIIKGLSIANNRIIPAYNFGIPYEMVHNIRENNTSNDNNILLDDRQTSHSQLSTVIHKAQTGY